MTKKLMTIAAIATLMFSLAACSAASTTKTPTTNPPMSNNPSTTVNTPSTTPASQTFTTAQLAMYNGKNGQPAYIAVSGVVYDVTNAQGWRNGSHQGVSAGQDLTSTITQAPHGSSVLKGLTVVGKLQ